jgi:hypothetical protein
MKMNTDLDTQITKLLGEWHVPQPSGGAIERVLLAASASAPKPNFLRWRMLMAAPALAAAMAFAIVSYTSHDTLPKNDPLLQQSALGVFTIGQQSSDAEVLP